jgi:hypothetical protein
MYRMKKKAGKDYQIFYLNNNKAKENLNKL